MFDQLVQAVCRSLHNCGLELTPLEVETYAIEKSYLEGCTTRSILIDCLEGDGLLIAQIELSEQQPDGS